MRLSFRLPVDPPEGFERVYEARLRPLLARRGLVPSEVIGRPTAAGYHSRLFDVKNPAEGRLRGAALEVDRDWQRAAAELGAAVRLDHYRTAPASGRRVSTRGRVRDAGAGQARETGLGIRRGAWQSFDMTDGFPATGISAITEDRHGQLWLATWNAGVCRYDGVDMRSYTTADGLPGNGGRAICEDAAGHMWFATDGGACRYDGAQFLCFGLPEGLPGDDVNALCRDRDGGLWLGFGQGRTGAVSRCSESTFTSWTKEDGLAGAVHSICQDRHGSMWFATDDGVSRWDGEALSTYTRVDGLADDRVSRILRSHDGDLWFATQGGVSRYDGESFRNYTTADGLANDSVWNICQDRDGDLWFATRAGVSRYDGRGFTTVTAADGLEGNIVGSFCEDHEGNLWFGTGLPRLSLVGTGVSRLGTQCRTFTTRDGLVDDHVVALAEDGEGSLWLGTWRGVSRWDGQRFSTLEEVRANVRAIVVDRTGDLWFGTYFDGVLRWDGRQLSRFTREQGLADDIVETMLLDRQGTLWVGTEAGVSRYDGERFLSFPLGEGSQPEVRAICQDRAGNVWFGTSGTGLWRYDGTRLTRFTDADGLPGQTITALLQDRSGTLWVCAGGFAPRCFDGRSFSPPAEAGALPRLVLSMMEDRDGHLWLCSYGEGVSRYDGLVVQALHQRNGLAHNGVQRALQDRHGDVWIATEGGVTRYRAQRTPPAVRLLRVVADRERAATQRFTLPVSQRRLAIQYRGRSFRTGRDQMAYVYRMSGLDAGWHWTNREEAVFNDLATSRGAGRGQIVTA